MKNRLFVCVMALAAAVARGEDRLVLATGPDEVLHGKFESFSKDGIRLRRRDAGEPLAFRPGAVVAVEFDRAAAPSAAAHVPGMALVRFNNGDVLPGKVVAYSPEKTVLETAAGRLEMASGFVRSLDFASGGGLGLDLLGKEADWKAAANGFAGHRSVFRVQQGKLVMEGYGGRTREAEQPESYTLVMEAGVHDGFYCLFGQDRPALDEGDGYMFRVQGARAWLIRQAHGNNESVANFVLPPAAPGAVRRRMSLAMDGAAKAAALTVDGKVVGRIKGLSRSPKGKHLMIGGNGGKVTLSRLSLVPGGPVGKAAAHDTLLLANRDRTQGRLVSIADGQAVFEGDAGKLIIPLARLSGVEFSSKHDKAPSRGDGARVLFSDLDGLTLRLDRVEGGRIRGQSAIFGPCEIGLDRVARIEFQPDKAGPPAREAGGDEGDDGEPEDEGEVFLNPRGGILRLRGGLRPQVIQGQGVIQLN